MSAVLPDALGQISIFLLDLILDKLPSSIGKTCVQIHQY